MKSLSTTAIAVFVCLATAAFSQDYPMPGAAWEPAVLCTGCAGNNASGQPNNGLPTFPYGAPFVDHVGRVVDSTEVADFRGTDTGFATARARIVRVVHEQHGNVPPRIYIQIGNAIGVYSLDSFFATALPGGMKTISSVVGYTVHRGSYPNEKVLKWDAWIYPEHPFSGWELTFIDGQEKLYDFDIDDRGIVYVATGGNFGWGLVQDNGQTNGALLSLIPNSQVTGFWLGGIMPDQIVAIKSGSSYYAVTSSFDGGRRAYEVTSTSLITPGVTRLGTAFGFRAWARDDVRERIAIVTLQRKIEIYDNATFVSGGLPIASFTAPAGKFYRDVSVDESGNFWTSETTDTASNNKLVKLERDGSLYSEETFDVYGEPFTPVPGIAEGLATINYGEEYLTVSGRTSATIDLKIFKIEDGAPVPVNAGGFFAKHYHKAPTDHAQPRSTSRTMGGYPINWNNKLYLLYNVHWLVDVYQFDDGKPTISTMNPSTGLPVGGTTITVYGTNFGATPTLTIDGAIVGSTLMTPNRLDAETPPHAPGVVDVIVNSSVDSSAPKTFTYVLPTPENFFATATSTTSVTANWNSVVGATQYEVQRRQPDLSWLPVGTTTSLTLTESGLSSDTSYLYRVRALDASANASSPSPLDLATTAAFVGQTIVPGMSIQASHINDLRTSINALRTVAGIGPATFGETVTAGTIIRAQHFYELRNAVQQARSAIAAPASVFTDYSLDGKPVKAVHVQELMDAVK